MFKKLLDFKRRLAIHFRLSCLDRQPRDSRIRQGQKIKCHALNPNKKGKTVFWVPGVFKLDHLQPFKPILYRKFSNFWLLYWGRPIPYYPRKMRKWNSPNLGETQDFGCLGHSNWTICSPLSQFCTENFPTFDFYTGEGQFLITPGIWENEIHPTWVRHRVLGAWSIQTGPFAAL